MNSYIIFDSSALISLLLANDSNHSRALAVLQRLRPKAGSLIVPLEVLSETLNVVGMREGHRAAVSIARVVMNSGDYILAETSGPEILENALVHFANLTKAVSYIDCLVMAFADHYQTSVIFGFDNAFRKEGYHLPRLSPAA